MKNYLLLLVGMAISTTVFSQNFLGMKIKKFGIATTIDQDRVSGMDAEYFSNLSKTGLRSDLANQEFPERDIISMTCENPAARLDITVLPFRARPNFQLNLGTSIMFNRLDDTEYGWYDFDNNDSNYNNISFNSYSHEAALEGTLLYNAKLAFLNFYGGAGTNLGYTFAGGMYVSGSYVNDDSFQGEGVDGGSFENSDRIDFREYHEMKNSLHQRVFLHGGVSVIFFKRLELGVEMRRGVGYRYNSGNPFKFTSLVSGGLNMRWNLK